MGGKSGGGGGSYVAGYKYHMGVQIIACHGPVDSLNRIIVGEREAFVGSVTSNQTIYIDKPQLFGGDSREGGVQGYVDVMMGATNQARNDYLATHQGVNCSAYRGLVSILFKQFMWASGNPYFKSPWVELTRVLKGWQGNTPWNPTEAVINGLDMNPAHIIYQCLTDTSWGMGYNPADIDEASFLAASAQLKAEGFGLSLAWDKQSSIEAFVQTVVDHINGAVGINLSTGKFRLTLIRDNYVMAELLELNESNIIELRSFQRAAYGDSANEVVVTYTNRDQSDATIAVQDIASIAAQGAVISVARSYPGIRTADLAARVALRELKLLSAPLAKVVLVTNRVMWDREKGDVVKLVWPNLGIAGAAFRVIDVDKGTLTDGKITVTMVEDVFGLPLNSYTSAPPSQWVDTVKDPVAVDAARAIEAPYWEVVRNISLADQANLQPDYGFGMFMASRGAVRSTLNYTLSASADNTTYRDVGTGHFSPVGSLASTIGPTVETFSLSGAYDLESVQLAADGGYAYIEDECVAVTAINPTTGEVSVKRGILDTVPATHSFGSKMYFVTRGATYDATERVAGETVYYKPLPTTGLGTLDPADAVAETLTLANRASRPYPPGNFKVEGAAYPTTINGPNISASWSHRDRLAQTVSFIDYSAGNIGPEPGVTYRMRVYNGSALLRTYDMSGDTASWSYPTDDDVADGRLSAITLHLTSVRDGIESHQAVRHTFNRLVVAGGTFVNGPPATPTLTAISTVFSVTLNWTFGDARTNLVKTEIWVSKTPQFADGAPLQYIDYPTTQYVHEIEQAGAFRWYWIRVYDNAGQLSQWSAIANTRAGFSSGVPTVAVLPVTPTPGVEVVRLPNGDLYSWDGAKWIKAGDIVARSITANEIAARTITANEIAADTITANEIAAGTITANEIAAGTITANKIAAGTLTADKFQAGELTVNEISVGDYTGYAWPAAGGTGVHLSSAGILAGNPNPSPGNPLGKYFQVYTPANGTPSISTNIPAYIEDLQVTTLKIGNNAVTFPVYAEDLAQFDTGIMGASSETGDLVSATITSSGAPIHISGLFAIDQYILTVGRFLIRIYRDGSLLKSIGESTMGYFIADSSGTRSSMVIPLSFMMSDTPPAGSHTYSVRLFSYLTNSRYKIGTRSISLLETKK